MKEKIYKILLVFILLTPLELYSQVPEGYILSYDLLDNKDTLKIDRYHGDWWFGLYGGPNLNLFFGDLFSKEHPQPWLIQDPTNKTIQFNSVFGGGYYLGMSAEYKPRNQHWGYGLNLTFFDRKLYSPETNPIGSQDTIFENRSILDYLILSPMVKYYTSLPGVYYFGSLDIGFSLGLSSKQRRKFENVANVEQFLVSDSLYKPNTRIELNLGVGWEFLVADFYHLGRIHVNPYAGINMGSTLISDMKSSWNTIGFKLGVGIKFGKDHCKYDTLKFDPTYIEPPKYVATIEKREINFWGFTPAAPIVAGDLKVVETPQVIEEVAEVVEPEFKEELKTTQSAQIRKRVSPDRMEKFEFDKPATTSLSPEMKDYLDVVAEYLKSNPKAIIRITGHSDATGSIPENTERSRQRAENAKSYLKSRAIPDRRILIDYKGSLSPIAPATTSEGQRKNRRIEIIIVNSR